MVATIIVMMVVTVLLGVIFLQDIQALPLARQAQDYQGALQAADSGVEDFINRLDNNATYYNTTSDASNPALENGASWSTWAAVPGTTVNEWFRYSINSAQTAQSGVVFLTVTGAAGQNPTYPAAQYSLRTVRYAIRMSGFTSFLYYTDYEIRDPAASGLPASCKLHAWEWNGSGYGPASSCSGEQIYFVGQPGIGDVLNGPIFSNDALHVCGSPSFPQGATTYYDETGAGFGGPGALLYDTSCTNAPTFKGAAPHGNPNPQPAPGPQTGFPTTNGTMLQDIPAANNGGGCAYVGPIHVSLSVSTGGSGQQPTGAGQMTVTADTANGTTSKVDTTATPPANTCLGTNIALPPNGLIYDEDGTAVNGCGSPCAANVTVNGTLHGQLTIGSQTNITINGNIVDSSMTGTDMMGLSALSNIIIVAPCTSSCGSANLTIDAAMVALNHSIYVQNYSTIPAQGTLNINGSLAQVFRGPVGTFSVNGSGTYQIVDGYTKNYNYDTRLLYEQPPYFTSPTLPNWTKMAYSECTATAQPSPTVC